MADYGHDLAFGVFLTPTSREPQQSVRLTVAAEKAGLDIAAFQDHPYQPAFLDTWTLMSYIGARTSRIQLLPDVANLPLRHPAVLAHSAASLDLLTGGRVVLGLGAGAFWDAIAAMGGPRRTPGEAVEALADALDVIRELWDPTRRPVRAGGSYYRVEGAKPGPAPAHEVPVWIGAAGPRMLRLIGRTADGWVPSSGYLAPERLAEANAVIDDAASRAGRSPAAVRRVYNVSGSFDGDGRDFLRGQAPVWAEQLAELVLAEGMSVFILASDDESDIRRFAAEVAPATRELVTAERAAA